MRGVRTKRIPFIVGAALGAMPSPHSIKGNLKKILKNLKGGKTIQEIALCGTALILRKILQIIFYASAACLGLWCGYTIAILRLKFENKCYLFTSIKVVSENDMNYASVNWESDSWCDYCQYCMVSSFIVATIWATFFLMCGKGGKSISGSVRLIVSKLSCCSFL